MVILPFANRPHPPLSFISPNGARLPTWPFARCRLPHASTLPLTPHTVPKIQPGNIVEGPRCPAAAAPPLLRTSHFATEIAIEQTLFCIPSLSRRREEGKEGGRGSLLFCLPPPYCVFDERAWGKKTIPPCLRALLRVGNSPWQLAVAPGLVCLSLPCRPAVRSACGGRIGPRASYFVVVTVPSKAEC